MTSLTKPAFQPYRNDVITIDLGVKRRYTLQNVIAAGYDYPKSSSLLLYCPCCVHGLRVCYNEFSKNTPSFIAIGQFDSLQHRPSGLHLTELSGFVLEIASGGEGASQEGIQVWLHRQLPKHGRGCLCKLQIHRLVDVLSGVASLMIARIKRCIGESYFIDKK